MSAFARTSTGMALLAVVASCVEILDLSEPGDLVEAVSHTCGCSTLINQGNVFTDLCETRVSELTDPELLNIGGLNCGSCTEVEPCYAAITNAAPAGGDCTLSEDCATWACHAGQLTVRLVFDGGRPAGPEIGVVDDKTSTCAGKLIESGEEKVEACVACGPVVDQLLAQVPPEQRHVACGEAKAAASGLLSCLWQMRQDADCPSCALPATFPQCLDCLYADDTIQILCAAELGACGADVPHPREGG